MRPVNAAAQAIREQRGHLVEIPMMWVAARDRGTNLVEGIGLWQGEDVERITIRDMFDGNNYSRNFYPMGILNIDSVTYEAGFNIRPTTIRLSSINDAVLVAVRQYDVRGAQVQLWKRIYNDKWSPVAIEPWFKGMVDGASSERPGPGGEATLDLEIVPTARYLTIPSSAKSSREAQKKRMGDEFLKYVGTTAAWQVAWGTKDEKRQNNA